MGASVDWSARTRRKSESRRPLAACVIEADDVDRGGVSSLLRNMGFATHETGSGEVGRLIAQQIPLGVIVVNLTLEDADGLRLVRQLRAKARSSFIIALTPYPSLLASGCVPGADAVLASPPCGEALCATITDALGLAEDDVIEAAFVQHAAFAARSSPSLA